MSPYIGGEYVEPDNAIRAGWAKEALEAYAQTTRLDEAEQVITIAPGDEEEREHLEEVASDLVGDLMHLCRLAGVDFDVVTQRAEYNFSEEVAEEKAAEEGK